MTCGDICQDCHIKGGSVGFLFEGGIGAKIVESSGDMHVPHHTSHVTRHTSHCCTQLCRALSVLSSAAGVL